MGTRWSDDLFLDGLRAQTDVLADATVAQLEASGGRAAVNEIFKYLHADEREIPAGAPPAFLAFCAATKAPLPDLDLARLDRGGAVFLRHSFSCAVVLLLSSLPNGYAAPCLSRILTVSGDLVRHPYKRLLGVLQLLIDVSQARAFRPSGAATVAAQKMRLMHAGVRRIVPQYRPDYVERYGPPVNHEDMLATIMGFSWLVIDGLRTLGAGLRADEEQDLYELWREFARMMGIHPPGAPHDASLVPATVAEAGEFYQAYCRRHFVDASENPDGVKLAAVNLAMVQGFVPWWGKLIGLGMLPRLVMGELLGDEGMRRVGMSKLPGHRPLLLLFAGILRCLQWLSDETPGHLGERLGRLVFSDLIEIGRGGEISFLIPESLADLRELA